MVNVRDKGRRGELNFAKAMYDELGVRLTTNLEQARNGGSDLLTVDKDPISKAISRYSIEVKRNQKTADNDLIKYWTQAVDQAIDTKQVPLLAYRKNNQVWNIVIPLNEVFSIVDLSLKITEDYPTIEWTIRLSVEGFGALIRETPRITL